MKFFICKRAKKIISLKLCEKNARLSLCRDPNGISIHCGNGPEAVLSKKYTVDEVFGEECISEYVEKCMSGPSGR